MCVLLKIRAPKGGFCSDAIEEPFLVPQPLEKKKKLSVNRS